LRGDRDARLAGAAGGRDLSAGGLGALRLALALVGLALALWLARAARTGLCAVARERESRTRLDPPDSSADAAAPTPSVSVLVPARNEAARIGPCVASLLALDYPLAEVLVADDGSTDGTAAVARRAAAGDGRLRVVDAGPLPEGWTGKNHALWRAQAGATGDWLLFTDADTRHAPGSLRAAVARALREGAGLLSLAGRQVALSLAERLVQPFVFEFLARRFPLAAVNDPADARAAANGQYLLLPRAVYDAIGGHAAVRGDLLEDVALARLAKARGVRVLFLAAPDLLSVRMYEGARSLGEGWTKNLADLAGGPAGALAEGARFLARGLLPPAALVAAALALAAGRGDLAVGPLVAGTAGLAAIVAEGAGLARLAGGARGAALLAPLGAAAAGSLFVRSAWRRSGGRQVDWRGRRYQAGVGA
jgi:chlorobactene glucosyltransferase